MFFSLSLLLIATLGGFVLTYIIERDMRLMSRIFAGHVIGVSIWGTVAFGLGFVFNITGGNAVISLGISLLPILLLINPEVRQRIGRDWKNAQTSLQGNPVSKALSLAYYLFFFILIVAFFDRAMIVRDGEILTGAANNFGDLPAHLGAIHAFTEGLSFPPENPSFAGSTFTYPFLIDLVTALMTTLGSTIQNAMLVQNVFLCLAIVVLLERFSSTVSGSSFVGKLVPFLFLFGGGLGFLTFFSDYWNSSSSLTESFWNLSRDHTIGDDYRWGNPMTTMLITQRSFLIGLPLALLALTKIWETTTADDSTRKTDDFAVKSMFLMGLLIGMLPLVHVHTLLVLFIVCATLMMFCKKNQIKEVIAFGIGTAVFAIPELLWLTSDSASQMGAFVKLQSGWETSSENPITFWLMNTGILIPMSIAGLVLVWRMRKEKTPLLNFYIPFLLIFVIGNFVALAPWGWDNIKVLVYWFIASLVFVSIAIEKLWRAKPAIRVGAVVVTIVLVTSGGLDVWRVASGQVEVEVFNREIVGIAEEIRGKLPADSLFVHEPTHNSPLVLTGRKSLMRYPGHLFSYGIDYKEREEDVRHILSGGNLSQELIEKYGIDYILVTEQERSAPDFNEANLSNYRLVISKGASQVYKTER